MKKFPVATAGLTNKYVLYGVFLVAIIVFIDWMGRGDWRATGVFVASGILASFFSKNMIVIISTGLVISGIYKYGIRKLMNPGSSGAGGPVPYLGGERPWGSSMTMEGFRRKRRRSSPPPEDDPDDGGADYEDEPSGDYGESEEFTNKKEQNKEKFTNGDGPVDEEDDLDKEDDIDKKEGFVGDDRHSRRNPNDMSSGLFPSISY
jgi:hypothetical protein